MARMFIAGNWKMHMPVKDALQLMEALYAQLPDDTKVEIAVCPPFLSIGAVVQFVREQQKKGRGLNIKVGAQNMHWKEQGAFTGEVSAAMLKEAGCHYVILGHSERRTLFGETNDNVSKKALAALSNGLLPIICIGETLDEREKNLTNVVLTEQLKGSLAGLTPSQIEACTLAYEPVWAIGTGKTASPEMAQQAHAFIRQYLASTFGASVAKAVCIQYGGSVKPDNTKALTAQSDIDGALVGGASLEAKSFSEIIKQTVNKGSVS